MTLIEYQIFAKNASFYYNIYDRNVINMLIKQLKSLFLDIKYDFIRFFDDIHKFLNRYFNDQILEVLLIALVAIIAVTIFVKYSTGSNR